MDFADRQAHGTHIVGTVGPVGNNQIESPVLLEAQIMGIKVLNDQGFGTQEMILNGLTYASQTQAKIKHVSWRRSI